MQAVAGFHIGRKRSAVYLERLLAIEAKENGLTPEAILKDAARKESPLHAYFEWSDTEAAQKWRIHQAHQLLCEIKVVIEKPMGGTQETRAFYVSVSTESFRNVEYVMSNEVDRKYLLAQAMKELDTIQRKFQELAELDRVWSAIRAVKRRAAAPAKAR